MAAPEPNDPLGPKLFVVLSRAHEAIRWHAAHDAERHDLSLAEFGVLEALHHLGPLRLCDIREKILVSSGGITYLVDRLEERGLVDRQPDPEDRRARLVTLTDEGSDLIAEIFPEHAARLARATSGLDRREKERAIELLRKLGKTAASLRPAEDEAARPGDAGEDRPANAGADRPGDGAEDGDRDGAEAGRRADG